MKSEVAQQITALESHLAHLERQYEQLNEAVVAQGRQIAGLQTLLRRLGQSLETIELERVNATNPKPPHYL